MKKEEKEEGDLPEVEVFSPSEGKPSTAGDLVASESRVEYRSPTYSEAPPRRVGGSRGESGLRKRPPIPPRPAQPPAQRPPQGQRPATVQRSGPRPAPGARGKQGQPPRPKQPRPPPPPQSNRREGFQYQDNYAYDPRPQDPNTSPAPQIFPIPIEFINQIPGVGQPLQQGSIRLEPESTSFQPSSHIEQIVNGIPKLVEDTSSEPFFLEVDLDPKKQNPSTRSLHHQETPIFREEYPRPQGTPYPPVPYHDTRHDVSTPSSTATQATGEGGLAFSYMAAPHKVLHDGGMVSG